MRQKYHSEGFAVLRGYARTRKTRNWTHFPSEDGCLANPMSVLWVTLLAGWSKAQVCLAPGRELEGPAVAGPGSERRSGGEGEARGWCPLPREGTRVKSRSSKGSFR